MPKLKDPERPPLEHLTLFFHEPALRYMKDNWQYGAHDEASFGRWLVVQMLTRLDMMQNMGREDFSLEPWKLIDYFGSGRKLVKVSVRVEPSALRYAYEVWRGELKSRKFWSGFGVWMAALSVINVALLEIKCRRYVEWRKRVLASLE